MAGTEMTPTSDQQRICALRLPGTSRARFADAAAVEVALGDWIAIDAGFGEEPGQLVVAPDQWVEPVSMDDVPSILRALDEAELETVAENMERALELIAPAGDCVRDHAPGLFLCGLRLTLAGDRAIAAYIGDGLDDPAELERRISEAIAMPVNLEQDRAGSAEKGLLGGSTGALDRRPETFQDLLKRRFDVLRTPGSFAPHGMPRLGVAVQTPHGGGTLLAVDIRRWRATVAKSDGEEFSTSVDDLRQP